VSQNGTDLTADITLVNQSTYILSSPGFLGEDTELNAEDITLTAENGTTVNFTKSDTRLTFPAGNYTLTYSAPVSDGTVYARYEVPFNVSVFLPVGFDTGHPILGTVEYGGKLAVVQNTDEYSRVVRWTDREIIQMRFFSTSLLIPFYLFLAVWGVVFAVAGLRYRHLRNKAKKEL
jgi:hypothetical protein